MEDIPKTPSEMGKKSAQKRGLFNMTKEQRSEYMKTVRSGKSPVTPQE
jgi:hypothetical protein